MKIPDKNRQLALRQNPTLLGVPLNRAERRQIQRGEVFSPWRQYHNVEASEHFFIWGSNMPFHRFCLQHQIEDTLDEYYPYEGDEPLH